MRWILLVTALLAGELGIQNQPAEEEVVLYWHLDGHQDAPLALDPPPRDHAATYGVGIASHSTACGEAAGQPILRDFHEWYAFLAIDQVRYEEGRIQYQRITGSEGDVTFATDGTLHWYVEAVPAPGVPGPTVVPQVRMDVKVRTGNGIGLGDDAYDGTLLGSGVTAVADLSPRLSGHPHVSYEPRGDRDFYHFSLQLPLANQTAVRDEGFNVRVSLFQEVPACSEESKVMTNQVLAATLDGMRPRLETTLAQGATIQAVRVDAAPQSTVYVEVTHPITYSGPAPLVKVGGLEAVHLRTYGEGETVPGGGHCHCYRIPTTFAYTVDVAKTSMVEVVLGDHRAVAQVDPAGRAWNVTSDGVEPPAEAAATPWPAVLVGAGVLVLAVFRRRPVQ